MLKILNSEFIKSATKKLEYPSNTPVVEFAFFGRSNAGKSSLINLLLNRKNLVKVSSTPGKTRSLNFFLIEGALSTAEKSSESQKISFVLSDLPGYGYANVNKTLIKNIDAMLYEYCTNRKMLKKMFLLIDIRREEVGVEREVLSFFQSIGVSVVVVATKVDKIAKTKVKSAIERMKKDLSDESVLLFSTSTLKKCGREEILSLIESEI